MVGKPCVSKRDEAMILAGSWHAGMVLRTGACKDSVVYDIELSERYPHSTEPQVAFSVRAENIRPPPPSLEYPLKELQPGMILEHMCAAASLNRRAHTWLCRRSDGLFSSRLPEAPTCWWLGFVVELLNDKAIIGYPGVVCGETSWAGNTSRFRTALHWDLATLGWDSPLSSPHAKGFQPCMEFNFNRRHPSRRGSKSARGTSATGPAKPPPVFDPETGVRVHATALASKPAVRRSAASPRTAPSCNASSSEREATASAAPRQAAQPHALPVKPAAPLPVAGPESSLAEMPETPRKRLRADAGAATPMCVPLPARSATGERPSAAARRACHDGAPCAWHAEHRCMHAHADAGGALTCVCGADSTAQQQPDAGSTGARPGAPEQGTVAPEQGVVVPEQGTGAPEKGTGVPEQGIFAPEQGTVAPEKGTVAPEQGIVAPEQGTVAPEKGTGAPEQGMVAAEKGTGAPEQGTVAPEQGTVAPDTPRLPAGAQPAASAVEHVVALDLQRLMDCVEIAATAAGTRKSGARVPSQRSTAPPFARGALAKRCAAAARCTARPPNGSARPSPQLSLAAASPAVLRCGPAGAKGEECKPAGAGCAPWALTACPSNDLLAATGHEGHKSREQALRAVYEGAPCDLGDLGDVAGEWAPTAGSLNSGYLSAEEVRGAALNLLRLREEQQARMLADRLW
jgi:hypothetical protein